jgi:hypothetical protein
VGFRKTLSQMSQIQFPENASIQTEAYGNLYEDAENSILFPTLVIWEHNFKNFFTSSLKGSLVLPRILVTLMVKLSKLVFQLCIYL